MTFDTTSAPIGRGELARRSGCHLETVRYYENIGLMPPPARSEGGHRRYTVDDQRRLRFILRGRDLGFAIDDLRSLLSLAHSRSYTCGDIRNLTVDHLATVRRKISELKRLERTLSDIAGKCTGGKVPDCPVIDALWAD